MDESVRRPGPHEKALRVNLDACRHGTFAEIGGGQEVARWFFRVGGAAGTVAKTISAYDMVVSDALYGPTKRYVSRERLESMLDHEYRLVVERLESKREKDTAFFAFANTVATRSYTRQETGRGWIGIRFQHESHAEPSDILLHAWLFDTEPVREQEALGVLGVNLVYGAFYEHDDPSKMISSLMDALDPSRMEIDMIDFRGPAFDTVDTRLMSLQLVEQGFTRATMFTADGKTVQPADALHERPIIVERGSFRPVTNTTLDMVERASEKFSETLQAEEAEPVVLMEMSLCNLLENGKIDHSDFLARADMLGALGKFVMISKYAHHHGLVTLLRRYTNQPVVLVIGIPNLIEVFDEKYYEDLDGGVLEGIGRLFQRGVRLYVYPSIDPDSGKRMDLETVAVPPKLRHLYQHLRENGFLEPIEHVNEDQLQIFPRDVLRRIQQGDSSWESMIPKPVVRRIQKHGLFGHRQRSM